MKVYHSVIELIGGTPLLELAGVEKEYNLDAKIYAKLECFNPCGSAKDRVALQMINDMIKEGKINKDSAIIEPTSGNTGIGLALVGTLFGIRTVIVMPDSMSPERIKLMKAYGAEVVLTPGKEGMAGAIKKAKELNKEIPGSVIAGQFENPSNALAHYKTTGPEIWQDTDGKVDIFVAGIGTGGTITGTGRYLKEKNKDIKVIGMEPKSSPFITEGKAGAHKIQGIGAGFIPGVLNLDLVDEVMTVTDEDAYTYTRLLPRLDGMLVGISSGAALCAAIEVAKRPENKGKNIVVLLPDTGMRYLSADLF